MTIHELVDIAKRVHDAEGVNIGSSSTREYRNRFWARVVGIAYHGHPVYNATPDKQWHLKDGGNGRPQSDDVAVSMPSRHFWDCIPNAGADGYRFEASGDHGPLPPEQNVYPPPVSDGGGGVVAPPVVSDVWTPAHEALRVRLGANASALTIAQQLAHSFPDEKWGQKRAAALRPVSDDTIARKMAFGRLFGVRVKPSLQLWGILGAEQVFEPVAPVNHLGDPVVVVPPVDPVDPIDPPVTPVAPVDLTPVLDAIKGLSAKLDAVHGAVEKQRQEVLDAVRGQSYDIDASAGYLGRVRGTIKPKGQA